MNKHIYPEIIIGPAVFEDETEFDCDACGKPHFRENGEDYEDRNGDPVRLCGLCASVRDIPRHWRLTLKGCNG